MVLAEKPEFCASRREDDEGHVLLFDDDRTEVETNQEPINESGYERELSHHAARARAMRRPNAMIPRDMRTGLAK